MIEVNIDRTQLDKKLKELTSKVTNLRPVMRAISENMIQAVKDNFDSEGSRLGEKWKELSPSTKAQRSKKGFSGKILQQRRKLFDSITAYADDEVASVGTNLKYAKVHQLGCNDSVSVSPFSRKVASRNIYAARKDGKGLTKRLLASGIGFTKKHSRTMNTPARPFLGLNDNDVNGIQNTITKYLQD